MAFVTVSGEPGCWDVELARAVAQRLEWELVTERERIGAELGEPLTGRAWRKMVRSKGHERSL